MDTLTKLQTIRDFEKWAAARKIDASPLALLEYLDQATKQPATAINKMAAALAGLGGPVTNFDKIKNMNWEELAAFLNQITTRCFNAGNSPDIRICAACEHSDSYGHCDFKNWLFKEVNEL